MKDEQKMPNELHNSLPKQEFWRYWIITAKCAVLIPPKPKSAWGYQMSSKNLTFFSSLTMFLKEQKTGCLASLLSSYITISNARFFTWTNSTHSSLKASPAGPPLARLLKAAVHHWHWDHWNGTTPVGRKNPSNPHGCFVIMEYRGSEKNSIQNKHNIFLYNIQLERAYVCL